jgi:hypothetical protein
MAKGKIENIDELKIRIAMLRLQKAEQEIYFSQTLNKVSQSLSSPFSFIKSTLTFLGLRGNQNQDKEADWVTHIAKMLIPLILSKTILKSRGIIVKSLISWLTQSFINSKNFNMNTLSSWVEKITSWLTHISKKQPVENEDYGIPPESETFGGKPIH